MPKRTRTWGIVYRGLGRPADAKACYAEALRLNPNLAEACNNMGQILQEEGKQEESLAWYRRSLELDPGSVLVHCNAATVLKEQGKYPEAIAHYDMALRLDPRSADAHNGRAWVRQEQGHLKDAEHHYRKAIELRSDFALAHCNLGTVLEETGDIAGALRCFREALRHDPDHAETYSLLATLLGRDLPESDRAAMLRLVSGPNLDEYKRSTLHFGLGHVLDADGDFAAAAGHLRHANALGLADWNKRGLGYEPAEHEQSITQIIEAYTPAFFERVRGWGPETQRPVFIIGLPRSGTTLTEQILASHSQVHGAGELALVRDTAAMLPRILNLDAPALACLDRLDRAAIQHLARLHLEKLDALDARRRGPWTRCPRITSTWACWPPCSRMPSSSTAGATCATSPSRAG